MSKWYTKQFLVLRWPHIIVSDAGSTGPVVITAIGIAACLRKCAIAVIKWGNIYPGFGEGQN